MDAKSKIKQLWRYLKIQDDETLIVRSYNHAKKSDEFFIAKMTGNGLSIIPEDSFPEFQPDKPFIFIQQLNSSGKHVIPSVRELIQDRLNDY